MLTDDPENEPHQGQRLDIVVIIAAIIFIVSIFSLVHLVKRGVEPQNCHMAGFNNCADGDAPVITAPHRRARLE